MSTSELRRGPGWWMDLEGQWNPPEEWPESSPPLPGWIRGADGLWTEPAEVDDNKAESTIRTNGDVRTNGAPTGLGIRPMPDVAPATVPPLESLTSPAVFGTGLDVDHPPHRQVAGGPITSKVGLSFSETTADVYKPDPEPYPDRDRRRATTAALLAAITASMFATGLILLLLLL
jgi:hypothetical protein